MMNQTNPTVSEIAEMARQLSPEDRARLIEQLEASLKTDETQSESSKPMKSLYGLWSDLGPAPSAEEIDAARKEMWGNFPREDI